MQRLVHRSIAPALLVLAHAPAPVLALDPVGLTF
jgi:hypothetical protein